MSVFEYIAIGMLGVFVVGFAILLTLAIIIIIKEIVQDM